MTRKKGVNAPLVSIVVPVFDEAKNIEPLHRELGAVTSTVSDVNWEIVFVDDGSRDDSLLVLARLADRDARVKVVALARNFGKEIALSAGVTYAQGDAIVTMDADLQHPPSLLPALLVKWEEGADVVVATRGGTARKTVLRRISSRLFASLSRMLSGNERIEEGGTDYRLIDRKVQSAFLLIRERRRAYRQLVDWLGFARATVDFDAGERHLGRSTYSIGRLWDLAIDMIVSRSSVPLRLLLYVGFLISAAATLSLAWMFLAFHYVDPKWKYTPLAQALVFNTLLIGIILTAIGVLGLYVARIHEEVLQRPLFTVRATRNLEEPARPAQEATASSDVRAR